MESLIHNLRSGARSILDEDLAALLQEMLNDLAALSQCLRLAKGGQVVFTPDRRSESCSVLVDGVERFRIDICKHIEFTYELAAARSDDRQSYTCPPMKWGSRNPGADDDDEDDEEY